MGTWRDVVRHSVLPLLGLPIPGAAGVARYARQSLGEAAQSLHARNATARGVARVRVERRYVLRVALTPLVVLFGLMLPRVIARALTRTRVRV